MEQLRQTDRIALYTLDASLLLFDTKIKYFSKHKIVQSNCFSSNFDTNALVYPRAKTDGKDNCFLQNMHQTLVSDKSVSALNKKMTHHNSN